MTKLNADCSYLDGDLTDEELHKIKINNQIWIDRICRTEPIDSLKITESIKKLYSVSGLDEPIVVVVPSPLVMAVAGGLAAGIWDATRAATWAATRAATRDATWAATRDATRDATWDATSDATWDATRAATRDATLAATLAATWAATSDATSDATMDAVGAVTEAATRAATSDATRAATRAATLAATLAATSDATMDATLAATLAATSDATRAATRAATWAATRAATRAATLAATLAATSDATMDAVGAVTEAATRAATRAATWDATRAATRDATWAATSDATWDATRAATRDATWDAVGENWIKLIAKKIGKSEEEYIFFLSCIKNAMNMYQGGNMWGQSCSFFDAIYRILGLKNKVFEKYLAWEDCAIHGGFRIIHEKFCMVSDFPEILKIENGQAHCANGPTHRWRDGWELFHLWGVRIEPELFARRDELTFAEIMALENIEQRMVLLKYLGAEKMFYSLDPRPKLLDSFTKKVSSKKWKDREVLYELYAVDGLTPQTEKMMKYVCPSTDRLYFSFVNREIEGVAEAMAMKEGCTADEWKTRVWES